MPKYKITRGYVVEATSKVAARDVFSKALANNKEDEYLEYVSIQELFDKRSTGWGNSLKEQLIGSSNSKR